MGSTSQLHKKYQMHHSINIMNTHFSNDQLEIPTRLMWVTPQQMWWNLCRWGWIWWTTTQKQTTPDEISVRALRFYAQTKRATIQITNLVDLGKKLRTGKSSSSMYEINNKILSYWVKLQFGVHPNEPSQWVHHRFHLRGRAAHLASVFSRRRLELVAEHREEERNVFAKKRFCVFTSHSFLVWLVNQVF